MTPHAIYRQATLAVALLFLGCGNTENNRSQTDNTSMPVEQQPIVAEPIPVEIPEPIPAPECNRDLAGTCRHNPPTMGALEVT